MSSTGITKIANTVVNFGSLFSSIIWSVLKKALDRGISNFLPAYKPNKYAPKYQVGMATKIPTSSNKPRSAPSKSEAATGPGCGGTKACITANAPAEGNAYLSGEPPKRLAILKMIGIITIKPASKKIGKPNSKEATPSASGALSSPNRPIKVSANTFAPPVTSKILPIIAPKPTNNATEANVPPKPDIMVGTTFSAETPVAIAVPKLTSVNEANACTFSFIINISRAAIAHKAIVNK